MEKLEGLQNSLPLGVWGLTLMQGSQPRTTGMGRGDFTAYGWEDQWGFSPPGKPKTHCPWYQHSYCYTSSLGSAGWTPTAGKVVGAILRSCRGVFWLDPTMTFRGPLRGALAETQTVNKLFSLGKRASFPNIMCTADTYSLTC